MYQFESSEQEAAFRAALAAEAKQHISGRIFDASGTELTVDDNTIVGTPTIDSRCIADEEVFNFGEMYIGELNIRIKNDEARAVELVGGEVRLSFGVDTTMGRITIPLGVWDIAEARRDNVHFLSITGHDHMARLVTPVGIDDIGVISLSTILNIVESAAGIEFAQTAAQITQMIAISAFNGTCVHFDVTCWDEVREIAQIIGGFAFANREGKIEFRRFGTESVLTIPASRRFRAELQEGDYGVRAVAYTDYGKTYTAYSSISHKTSSVLCFEGNKWIWAPPSGTEQTYYTDVCYDILYKLAFTKTIPGTVEFYGDPSLDLGDMVTLEGGIAQDAITTQEDTTFLVCSSFWQFRAPHTITAGGAPSVGNFVAAESSEGSGSSPVPSGRSITKNINTADLTPYIGALFPTERTVARARFSCKDNTNAFINCQLTILGTETANVTAAVYIDGTKQTIDPKATVSKGRYTTLTLSLDKAIKGGMHTVRVTASGVSELTEVTGYVFGQNITAEELIYSSDYTYTASGGKATVTGYTGSSEHLEIPEELGNAQTDVIGGTAFTGNTNITTVYIPDGVTDIAGAAGINYLRQIEGTMPDGTYGKTVHAEYSTSTARTGTFNSGDATNVAFRFNANDAAITPQDIGTVVISDGITETELEIFSGHLGSMWTQEGDWGLTIVVGDDGTGRIVVYSSGDLSALGKWCYSKKVDIIPNTVYTFERIGGIEGVKMQYFTSNDIGHVDTAWSAPLKSIPGNQTPDKNVEQWTTMSSSRRYWETSTVYTYLDSRPATYEFCSYYADLQPGHYKVIAEGYGNSWGYTYMRNPDMSRDQTPYMALIAEDNTPIIQRRNIFSDTSSPFHHEEYEFTISEPTKVGLYFKAINTARSDYGNYTRFMIVDHDVVAQPFTIDLAGGGTLSGVTCWEPYQMNGAFMNAENLAYVSIPESVKAIGDNAFANTAVTDIRISSECTYFPSSFPQGCHIWYYGDEPTPDGYYTAAQVDSLMSALDARVTALESQEGTNNE
jgi:hypothetical protein